MPKHRAPADVRAVSFAYRSDAVQSVIVSTWRVGAGGVVSPTPELAQRQRRLGAVAAGNDVIIPRSLGR